MGMYDQDETNLSKFNEAALKMMRIHELQRTINSVNANLLAYNQEFGKFNYEIQLSTTYSLMMEVYPKLKEEEQKILLEFYENIYDYTISNPIYKSKKRRDSGEVTSKTPDREVFNKTRKMLVRFEALIRMLLEKHGLGTPGRDLSGL